MLTETEFKKLDAAIRTVAFTHIASDLPDMADHILFLLDDTGDIDPSSFRIAIEAYRHSNHWVLLNTFLTLITFRRTMKRYSDWVDALPNITVLKSDTIIKVLQSTAEGDELIETLMPNIENYLTFLLNLIPADIKEDLKKDVVVQK